MFMHNSARPTDGSVRADGVPRGNVLIGTEEDFDGTCSQMGRLVLSDISDSLGGEPAVNSTQAAPYRMKALARDVRQVGYYRVATGDAGTDSLSSDVAWSGNLIYLFDMNRGIEILRLKRGAHASARMRSVVAPTLRRPARYTLASSLEGEKLVCPLFTAAG